MSALIEIGAVEVATDATMAYEINRPSRSQAAVDARIGPVAAGIIASDPTIKSAAENAVGGAVEDAGLLRQTELGAVRTLTVDDPLYSEVHLSRDYRRLGGALRGGGGVVGLLPGYTESASPAGSDVVLLTRDYRRMEPDAGEDGLTPQHVLDSWASRLPAASGFTSLVGIGDSMTTNYGGGLSQTRETARELGVSAFDRGGSGDTPHEIAFRLGAHPIRVTVPDGVIPASGEVPVVVETRDNAAGWWQARTWRCRLRGVDGQLHDVTFTKGASASQGGAIGECTIALRGGTSPVEVLPGTRIEHEQSYQDAARFAPAIVWIGRNDPHEGRILAMLEAILTEHRDPGHRVMIVPLFTRDTAPAGSPAYDADMAINRAIETRFPAQFFDSRRALIQSGLRLAGITPTPEDVTAIGEDRIPPSLRPSGDPTHLNDAGRLALARIHAIEIAARSW